MACAGDVPTLETLAAVDLLREHFPELQDPRRQRRRSDDAAAAKRASARARRRDFDALFTTDKPVIFAYHGYPWLIHRLTYRRTNHAQSPCARLQGRRHDDDAFDMAVLNELDRFHLAQAAVDRVPALAPRRAEFHDFLASKLALHDAYIREHGEDMPEIRGLEVASLLAALEQDQGDGAAPP